MLSRTEYHQRALDHLGKANELPHGSAHERYELDCAEIHARLAATAPDTPDAPLSWEDIDWVNRNQARVFLYWLERARGEFFESVDEVLDHLKKKTEERYLK